MTSYYYDGNETASVTSAEVEEEGRTRGAKGAKGDGRWWDAEEGRVYAEGGEEWWRDAEEGGKYAEGGEG